ncbi:hypothetical protein [Archaeoglobus profundus]|uniref:Envelope protein N-terminal domain-containing protein n=2 Tax=root TaxID=1 RepID=D2RFE2_ARCPA|nr:hypothetical protein [Archaeoglobus profundus]ADB58836.1 hypothetical protein Arcpr_1792 [Archaeoglobus profundus DSM 5631]
MKIRVILSIFLIATLMGQTVALPLIPIVIGIAGVSSGIIGYWLGFQKSNEYQKLLEDYEARLTNNTIQNDINTRLFLQELHTRDQNVAMLGQDISTYSKNYAWALAKYTALKALYNGSNAKEAQQLARQAVYEYYYNLTMNIITMANETAELVVHSLNYYVKNVGINSFVVDVPNTHIRSRAGGGIIATAEYLPKYGEIVLRWAWGTINRGYADDQLYIRTTKVNVLGKSFTVKRPTAHFKSDLDQKWLFANVIYFKLSDSEKEIIYNWADYGNTLSRIDSDYKQVMANLDSYVLSIAQKLTQLGINETDLIDPYVLASQLNTDLNSTGYYGYVVAELALLGLPIAGSLDTSISITVYNESGVIEKTLEGYLFTDWNTTFEVGENYTVPSGTLVYFVSDEGLWKIPEGYTIHINRIVNPATGKELKNTTIYKYVDHSGDIQTLYEEVAKIRDLYEQYLEMSTTVGGGSSGSEWANAINEFWNSLDWQVKAVLIGGGALTTAVLIGRRK